MPKAHFLDTTNAEEVEVTKRAKIDEERDQLIKEKYKDFDTEDILRKILASVRGKKQAKSLPLLKKFLLERFDLIRPNVLFNSFVYLMQSEYQDKSTVEQIYYHLLEIADSGEFSETQVAILDVYYIKAVICAQFDPKMDDSFKFSQVTKTLLSILEDEVTEYTDEEIEPMIV